MPAVTPPNKKKRIAELIKRLEQGESVQARDMNLVLTPSQAKAMDEAWANQKDVRKPVKPKEIKEYEKLLKQAVMLYGRYEKYENETNNLNATTTKKERKNEFTEKTKLAIKDAQYYLVNEIAKQSSLREWFDREFDLDGVDIGLELVRLPRLITSRSENKLVGIKDQQSYKTIKEVKLDALRNALIEIDAEILEWNKANGYVEQTEEQTAKLKQKLASLFADKRRD
jgi:hypothetical protein